MRWAQDVARIVPDPAAGSPVRSADADDDYLIALASSQRAALVSGDKDLLVLSGTIPVFLAREFLDLLAGHR